MISRNDVWNALFVYLKKDVGVSAQIKSASQALEHWKDVNHDKCPRLTVVDTTADAVGGGWGKPSEWQMSFIIYVYTKSGKADASAQRQRNTVIDAVVSALSADPALQRQTLSGAVFDCRISGAIETDNGTLGAESVGFFPVSIRPTV